MKRLSLTVNGQVETVEVDLPRPRRLSIRETPEFAGYTRRIRTVFEATGVLSGEPE